MNSRTIGAKKIRHVAFPKPMEIAIVFLNAFSDAMIASSASEDPAISPEEMEKVVRRRSVLLGYDGDCLVGFIGEHLEGSMGLLYVFPEYRRRGFGSALQTHYIVKTMENGYIPFGQVEKSNRGSLKLQEKLGMTRSDNLIVWMWRQG